MIEFKTLTLRCDCMVEYVSFDYDEELDIMYVSLTGHKYLLWDALKLAWNILNRREWCWRDVILSSEALYELRAFLLCVCPMKGYDDGW